MNRPIVSVIIPVYNAHDHLRQCLDSVTGQTLKEIEIICVDDGSTDDTQDILAEYAGKDARVKVLRQENRGAGAARNTGLAASKGRYLSFLDADDFFEKTMLEKMARKLRDEKADFVVCRSDSYRMDTGKFHPAKYTVKAEILPPRDYGAFSWRNMAGNHFRAFVGWAWDKLYDGHFVRKNGFLFQEQRTTNDMLFVFSALVKARRISVVDEVLAHQRKNNQNSLSNTRSQSWHCFYEALKALREYLRKEGLYEELEQDFINYALHFSLWNLNTLAGETKEKLYDKLQTEWLSELGIAGRPSEYFYDQAQYQESIEILTRSFEEFPVKISVIIPVHNAEKYIGECLDSILNGNRTGLEVICVDDCSTDSSVSIMEEYASRCSNVKVLKNETNLYAGPSRNKGLLAAKGRYVHFVDSDDLVCPGIYDQLYPIATQNDLDWLKTTAFAIDDQTGERVENIRYTMDRIDPTYDGTLLDFEKYPHMFMSSMSLVPWNALYKKSFLLENNIRFNSLFCVNDRSFFVETCIKGNRGMVVRHDIIKHRTNVSGSLVAKRMEHFDCQFDSFRIVKKHCDDNQVSGRVRFRVLDAELFDMANWYRKFSENKTLSDQVRKDTKAFLQEEVDIPWFEEKGKDCQWLTLRKLLEV